MVQWYRILDKAVIIDKDFLNDIRMLIIKTEHKIIYIE